MRSTTAVVHAEDLAAKQSGLAEYDVLLTRFTDSCEARYVSHGGQLADALAAVANLAAFADIENVDTDVARMRIVPFDFVFLLRLILAAVVPMTPLILRWVPWPQVRDLLQTLVGR